MILHTAAGAVRRNFHSGFCRRNVSLGQAGPLVSFTFDDFPRSACTTGGEILKKLGFRATYYVAMGLMDTRNQAGEHFAAADLRSLAADGHELANHTFGHCSLEQTPLDGFQQDVHKGRQALRAMGIAGLTTNFAYPFGEVTLAAKKVLGAEMMSCRGIYRGLNGPLIDLNLLRANPIYGGLDRLSALECLIRENENRRSWLIFYTHDVRPNPSRFGCTPELLESAVRFAGQHSAGVLPVAEVVQMLQPSPLKPNKEC